MLSSYIPFSPWPMALMLVALCASLEAWLSGPKPFRFLASLKQPPWALPNWGWMIVGGTFYVIMTFGAAAMLQTEERGSAALVMVIAVMVTDGIWNYLLFRRRRLDWAYVSLHGAGSRNDGCGLHGRCAGRRTDRNLSRVLALRLRMDQSVGDTESAPLPRIWAVRKGRCPPALMKPNNRPFPDINLTSGPAYNARFW